MMNFAEFAGVPAYYKCEDGHFPLSASYVTFSNPDLLASSSEKEV
jgi:hypothetical protein